MIVMDRRRHLDSSLRAGRRRAWRLGTAAVAATALTIFSGCLKHEFQYWPDQRVAGTGFDEVILRATDTDLLIMIDNSPSTQWYHANLQASAQKFIQALSTAISSNNTSAGAFRIGIVTSDVFPDLSNLDSGRLRFQPASASQLASASPACAIGPSSSTPPWMDSPSATDASAQCRLVQDFISTVGSLGESGSGLEAGLLATQLALDSSDPTTSVTNSGFLRPDADLAVIYISDEDDASFADYIFACPTGCAHPAPRTCTPLSGSAVCPAYIGRTQYVQQGASPGVPGNGIAPHDVMAFFGSLKGAAGLRKVRAALIGGGVRGSSAEGTDFRPIGCRVDTSGQPSTVCECWAQNPFDPYFCPYNGRFGALCAPACSSSACTPCTSPPDCPPPMSFCSANPPACFSSQGVGTCTTTLCTTMPAERYHEALNDLAQQRAKLNYPPGVYEDSICQADFSTSLQQIVNTVVAPTCFPPLAQAPLPGDIQFILRQTDATTGAVTSYTLPCYDPNGDMPGWGCPTTCVDPNGAWHLDLTTNQICPKCGLTIQPGNEYIVNVINQIVQAP
jgi:hypothetical protein